MNRQQGQCYTNVLMPTPTPNLLVSLSAPHSDTRCGCARPQSTVETHGTHQAKKVDEPEICGSADTHGSSSVHTPHVRLAAVHAGLKLG